MAITTFKRTRTSKTGKKIVETVRRKSGKGELYYAEASKHHSQLTHEMKKSEREGRDKDKIKALEKLRDKALKAMHRAESKELDQKDRKKPTAYAKRKADKAYLAERSMGKSHKSAQSTAKKVETLGGGIATRLKRQGISEKDFLTGKKKVDNVATISTAHKKQLTTLQKKIAKHDSDLKKYREKLQGSGKRTALKGGTPTTRKHRAGIEEATKKIRAIAREYGGMSSPQIKAHMKHATSKAKASVAPKRVSTATLIRKSKQNPGDMVMRKRGSFYVKMRRDGY
jgi:hypothetical protein